MTEQLVKNCVSSYSQTKNEDALMANRAPHCQRQRWTSKYDRRTTSEALLKITLQRFAPSWREIEYWIVVN